MNRLPAPPRRQRGVTLIEILVTLALLGIGLLGLAGLQLRGVQVNQGSTYRSQAAFLAEDLADRMRVDVSNLAGYYQNWQPSTPATAGVAASLSDWLGRLGDLPNGCVSVASVALSSATDLATQITVNWNDTRALKSADTSGAATASAGAKSACTPAVAGSGSGSYVLVAKLTNATN